MHLTRSPEAFLCLAPFFPSSPEGASPLQHLLRPPGNLGIPWGPAHPPEQKLLSLAPTLHPPTPRVTPTPGFAPAFWGFPVLLRAPRSSVWGSLPGYPHPLCGFQSTPKPAGLRCQLHLRSVSSSWKLPLILPEAPTPPLRIKFRVLPPCSSWSLLPSVPSRPASRALPYCPSPGCYSAVRVCVSHTLAALTGVSGTHNTESPHSRCHQHSLCFES